MKVNSYDELKKYTLNNRNGLQISFLERGILHSINYKNIMINQLKGNLIDGCLNNIYLRIFKDEKIVFTPLIGIESNSSFLFKDNTALWYGIFDGIEYRCSCVLDNNENVWFWNVELTNKTNAMVETDIIYIQDLGLADEGAVRTNEAYTSQYIDHSQYSDKENGYVVCSRQNQSQEVDGNTVFPWIMQGALSKVEGFITDGFQFFGLNYKNSRIPEALKNAKLDSSNRQYEFALTGLQSEKTSIDQESKFKTTFFSYFEKNHYEASSKSDLSKMNTIVEYSKGNCNKRKTSVLEVGNVCEKGLFDKPLMFSADDLDDKEIEKLFGGKLRHKEVVEGKLLSFFYDTGKHVILKQKELRVERPHGHIMMSGTSVDFDDVRLSTTSYIYGLFNSLVSLGNTSFSRILSGTRNPLNIFKSCGQRIFVKIDGQYELLGLPSTFEMGKNYCRWIYKNRNMCFVVTSWTGVKQPSCYLDIEVMNENIELEFLISHNISAGINEGETHPVININKEDGIAIIKPDENQLCYDKFPETEYYIISKACGDISELGGSELLFNNEVINNEAYVVCKTKAVKKFSIKITGILEKRKENVDDLSFFEDFNNSVKENDLFWRELTNSFNLSLPRNENQISKYNDLIGWYAHNAMVHYLAPHGLEQYSGAAWGVRDVCQGPIEFFIANQNYKPVRQMLLNLFSHQYKQRGDWPQWYMFDAYKHIQQVESHGDVVVWPLKALCDYIEASGDYEILTEKILYADIKSLEVVETNDSLLEHILLLIETIKHNFISGTSLSCYGDGDWDDTLQPANAEQRDNMVSGWTVLLTYQTFTKVVKMFRSVGKIELAEDIEILLERIKIDYNKYVIKDEIAAGFVYFDNDKNPEAIIHPSDKKTGINYRLLPMIRGMISEFFTPEQALKHCEVIKEHLYCPDGVRLMDKPATYLGGLNKFFKRAETAAYFGREVGLQYVHAHIRYIEAMAKTGNADEVYNGLNKINPIKISENVKNAEIRQSNAYFSSSDGDFSDRYAAQGNFDKLKSGEQRVKGGWRIYSSGPGIYINQLVSSFLGIRIKSDDIEIDPVIPFSLNGLVYNFDYVGKSIEIKYIVRDREFSPGKIIINGKIADYKYLNNPYRKGGIIISKKYFDKMVSCGLNKIDIYM
jgi:1,2-beta-oligoglucan phosphorylase